MDRDIGLDGRRVGGLGREVEVEDSVLVLAVDVLDGEAYMTLGLGWGLGLGLGIGLGLGLGLDLVCVWVSFVGGE